MVISSLVVETFSKRTDAITQVLAQLDGVKVHSVNSNKIVVTIEANSLDASHDIANSFITISGVVNVNLIYANFEEDASIRGTNN